MSEGRRVVMSGWIGIHTGNRANLLYYGMSVGKGFNDRPIDGVFARAHPWGIANCVIRAVTSDRKGRHCTVANGIPRVFFAGRAKRVV